MRVFKPCPKLIHILVPESIHEILNSVPTKVGVQAGILLGERDDNVVPFDRLIRVFIDTDQGTDNTVKFCSLHIDSIRFSHFQYRYYTSDLVL